MLSGINPAFDVVSRQAFLAARATRTEPPKRITTAEVQVRVYDNTAVETGLSTMIGQDKGNAVPRDTRFTRVWVKRQGRWRLVANHYSTRNSQH